MFSSKYSQSTRFTRCAHFGLKATLSLLIVHFPLAKLSRSASLFCVLNPPNDFAVSYYWSHLFIGKMFFVWFFRSCCGMQSHFALLPLSEPPDWSTCSTFSHRHHHLNLIVCKTTEIRWALRNGICSYFLLWSTCQEFVQMYFTI